MPYEASQSDRELVKRIQNCPTRWLHLSNTALAVSGSFGISGMRRKGNFLEF